MAAKIKKGDTVIVLAGKDKGRTGEVLKSIPDENRVVVEGRQHRRPPHQAEPGRSAGRHQAQEAPIHVSNVAHRRSEDGKPTRVGFKTDDKGRKVRVAKGSGERSMSEAKYAPRLKTLYDEAIREKLNEQFNYTNDMQIPRARQGRDQHGRRRSGRQFQEDQLGDGRACRDHRPEAAGDQVAQVDRRRSSCATA